MLASLNAFLKKNSDFGLLVLRVGLGVMFLFHGYPKMFDGPAKWAGLGKAMGNLGVDFLPVFWGFMAAFSEFAGGFLLILGFLFRPAAFLLLCTMIVATAHHFGKGDDLATASHAIELACVFFGLIFAGPGKFSLDKG